ncbi:hypothetical protein HPB47_001062, partial [Ixodes persulcatus]
LRLSVYADKHHQSFAPINIIHHVEMRSIFLFVVALDLFRGWGLFVMGDAEGFVSASKFSHWKESEFQEILVPDPERTLMALAYTSGTTGLPKAVESTHFNYVASFYAYANSSSSLVQARVPPKPAARVAVARERGGDERHQARVTALTCFPTRLRNLVQYARSADRRLNTVLHIGVGGGVLSEQLAQAVLEHLREPSEPEIMNPTSGEAMKANEIGELCFRTPTASRGYYKRPLATAQFRDRDGWCRSGDLAYHDTDGRIHFVERIKEMIKCLDNQVVPAELEELLLANHDGIAEVAVVGLPHSVYGEAPAAVVVPKKNIGNGGQAMEREIKGIIA